MVDLDDRCAAGASWSGVSGGLLGGGGAGVGQGPSSFIPRAGET
ncbi:hypothetical protein ACQ856_22110 [Mycolicibacterium psychrotolerans]|nr:hypothetical protein [Mycobacterium sp. ELW1]